jgi:hypothetical protein
MGTSLAAAETIFQFAVGLATAARVFTLEQVGRHPVLSERTQPTRRARECLAPHPQVFECIPWLHRKPYLWRFTEREKRRRGIRYPRVGASQHTEHWLAIGDMWAHLVFNGLRPTKWFTEGKKIGRFDVFAEIQGRPYLMEVQLTPLSDREWETKWRRRMEWLATEPWKNNEWASEFARSRPTVILVSREPLNPLTPRNVLYSRTIFQLKYVLSGGLVI